MGLVLATEETGGGGTFCRGSWQSLTEDRNKFIDIRIY